jgi:hypothetical protein
MKNYKLKVLALSKRKDSSFYFCSVVVATELYESEVAVGWIKLLKKAKKGDTFDIQATSITERANNKVDKVTGETTTFKALVII